MSEKHAASLFLRASSESKSVQGRIRRGFNIIMRNDCLRIFCFVDEEGTKVFFIEFNLSLTSVSGRLRIFNIYSNLFQAC